MTDQLPIPVGDTAQRPTWQQLPEVVHDWLTDHLGAAVTAASSRRSGYTAGFASRLWLSDHRRVFAKIANCEHQWMVDAYQQEAVKNRLLPAAVPAPRVIADFRAVLCDRTWHAVIFEDVDGRPPHRPWTPSDAVSAIHATETAAMALTPAPDGHAWLPLSTELGAMDGTKRAVIKQFWPGHVGEMSELAEALAHSCDGNTLVHADLRDDNMIIGDTGEAWICDWNFPVLGKPWIDLVTLLISMYGDGLDTDTVLTESPCSRDAPADEIDSLLADLALYYRIAADSPYVDNSPHLRAHQGWYADVTAAWLAARRQWT